MAEAEFQGKPLRELFPEEERNGWRGYVHTMLISKCFSLIVITILRRYVEWESKPERKKVASELLATKQFTPIPGQSFNLMHWLGR